jgi:hypothetical protein
MRVGLHYSGFQNPHDETQPLPAVRTLKKLLSVGSVTNLGERLEARGWRDEAGGSKLEKLGASREAVPRGETAPGLPLLASRFPLPDLSF